jgi:acid phosphatase (class A)
MRHLKSGIAALSLLLLVSAGCAQTTKKAGTGYLDPGAAKDFVTVVPPAPHPGDIRDGYDHSVFRATRFLEASPRWQLAQQDNTYSAKAFLQDFSCAVGVELTSQNAPRLAALLTRLSSDSGTIVGTLKNDYKRSRPFLSESGNICIARSSDLVDSYDYPSGHATMGWLTGLVLAEMAPDRTGAILTRARAYGESRVVCGVHTASAVDAGRTLAGAILVALQGSPQYRDDFAAARSEVEALKKLPAREPSSCTAERSLTAVGPYDSLPSAGSADKAH